MPGPLSTDLRARIVAAFDAGGLTYDDVAARFRVGRASVSRFLRAKRERGSVEAKPRGGGRPRQIDATGETILRQLLRERSDATLTELAEQLTARGVPATDDGVFGALRRMGISRKKRPSSRPNVKAKRRASSGGTSSASVSTAKSRG